MPASPGSWVNQAHPNLLPPKHLGEIWPIPGPLAESDLSNGLGV
jgi:hypothetical protein